MHIKGPKAKVTKISHDKSVHGPLTAQRSEALSGELTLPGDKSISHRALMLGTLAVGETVIDGLLEGEDVLGTATAMSALGAEVEPDPSVPGRWRVWGRGLGGLQEPEDMLNLGNSGTGARLLLGVLAGHPITTVMTGDASLRGRPMGRVCRPLEMMGAHFLARAGDRLPLTVVGSADLMPLRYILPVASAQVKSAILLAGLTAPGETTVIEPQATRDHSENMLRHFGAQVSVEAGPEGQEITLVGQPELTGQSVTVPVDPSSAAFPVVAALLCPGSNLRLPGVGVNPLRSGLFDALIAMGADISFENRREQGGEPLADLVIKASDLQGIDLSGERAPSMIDEYPILAVAAACAQGRSVLSGLEELRVKESDRLAATARLLSGCGVEVTEGADSLTIEGCGGPPPGGNTQPLATELDHRIAMSALVLGLAAERPVTIDDGSPIATSFPGFVGLMQSLGAQINGVSSGVAQA